jgi:hypothetical protein
MLIQPSIVLKIGRVAIITRGRYAGKKVNNFKIANIIFYSYNATENYLLTLGTTVEQIWRR